MSQFTVGTVHGPVAVVDAADHFQDALNHVLPARTHLPVGLVLNAKARHASLRLRHTDPPDVYNPVTPVQSVEIWVTSTTHPAHPGNTYGTTWLLMTWRDQPPVAIAFTVLAGHPKKATPALGQTHTEFDLIRDLLPGIRGWLSGTASRTDPSWVPWRVLRWVHPVALGAAALPAPKVTPARPLVGRPASLTSALTWASVGVPNPETFTGLAKLTVTPDGYFRASDGARDANAVLTFLQQAHQKLIPIIETRNTGKRTRARTSWKQQLAKALELAVSWAYWETAAPPDWADRMYTTTGDAIPVGYVQETFAYGWTAEEADRFWVVHKMVCSKCQDDEYPGDLAEHDDTDLPLLGWATMKVGGRDASRYMLAGYTPDDVHAWAWNVSPPSQTLAVSAALVGFDVNLWDQVAVSG